MSDYKPREGNQPLESLASVTAVGNAISGRYSIKCVSPEDCVVWRSSQLPTFRLHCYVRVLHSVALTPSKIMDKELTSHMEMVFLEFSC